MKLLKDRILQDGQCFPGGILKVDNFINHQMDPILMQKMAEELANGNAAKGILDLVNQAGATVEGMGFLIEKGFQKGGEVLRSRGIHVESLAIIDSLDDCQIRIR